jgi:hypothetical protein
LNTDQQKQQQHDYDGAGADDLSILLSDSNTTHVCISHNNKNRNPASQKCITIINLASLKQSCSRRKEEEGKQSKPKKPNIQKITHGKKKGQVKYQIILSLSLSLSLSLVSVWVCVRVR